MKSSRIAGAILAITFLLSPVQGAPAGHTSFQQALDLVQKGRKAEALELFRRLTVEDSTNLEAWNNRAGLEAAFGNLDAACASLEHALAVRPDLAVLSRNLEKVRSRRARLAYDSAFGTPAKLQPLDLELRQNVSSTADSELRKEVDSLQTALVSAKDDARRATLWRDSITARDRESNQARGNQTSAGGAVVASAEPPSKAPAPAVSTPPTGHVALPAAPPVSGSDPLDAVKAWAKAWTDRDVEAYLAAYISEYHPSGLSHAEWVGKRRERIQSAKWIKVEVLDPKVSQPSRTRAEVVYRQVYQTEEARLTSRKRIGLTLLDDKWKIVEEKEAR